MTTKNSRTIGTLALAFGMLALEGCFVGGPRPVGSGYGYPSYSYAAPAPVPAAPVYAYARPAPPPPPRVVVRGDWDERHVWHERDWWVKNRREWVNAHHPEWIGSREHHG